MQHFDSRLKSAVGAAEEISTVRLKIFSQKAPLVKDFSTALQLWLLSTTTTALQPSLEMSDGEGAEEVVMLDAPILPSCILAF